MMPTVYWVRWPAGSVIGAGAGDRAGQGRPNANASLQIETRASLNSACGVSRVVALPVAGADDQPGRRRSGVVALLEAHLSDAGLETQVLISPAGHAPGQGQGQAQSECSPGSGQWPLALAVGSGATRLPLS